MRRHRGFVAISIIGAACALGPLAVAAGVAIPAAHGHEAGPTGYHARPGTLGDHLVFERFRFMLRFYRNYSAAKRSGADHQAALQAAATSTLDQASTGPDDRLAQVFTKEHDAGEQVFSDTLREALVDGEAHYIANRELDIEPYELVFQSLHLGHEHIGLIRQMRFIWDPTEGGAPMLDPAMPYGRRDILKQFAETFGDDDEAEQARYHVEMMIALARFLDHARLAPGAYALGNISADELRSQFSGYGHNGLTDAELGLTTDGKFQFSEDHAKLLKRLSLEWSDEDENEGRMDDGVWPAAGVDPKRPYGDMTFFEIDMADALGELPPAPPNGQVDFPPEQLERLGVLHWQMLGAIQVFVEHAKLEPGLYGGP